MKRGFKFGFGDTFDAEVGHRVFIQNVHPEAREQDFRDFFKDCRLVALSVWENFKGHIKSCATFASPQDASRAISKHKKSMLGWSLEIREYEKMSTKKAKLSPHRKPRSPLRRPSPRRIQYYRGNSRDRDRSRSRSPILATNSTRDHLGRNGCERGSRRSSITQESSDRRRSPSIHSRDRNSRDDRPTRSSSKDKSLVRISSSKDFTARDVARQSGSAIHEDTVDKIIRDRPPARKLSAAINGTNTVSKRTREEIPGLLSSEILGIIKKIHDDQTVRKLTKVQLKKLQEFLRFEELVMTGINPSLINTPTTTTPMTKVNEPQNGIILAPPRIQLPSNDNNPLALPSIEVKQEPLKSSNQIKPTRSAAIVIDLMQELVKDPKNEEIGKELRDLVDTAKIIRGALKK